MGSQSLLSICDWTRPESIAIEYHDLLTVRRITYLHLKDATAKISAALAVTVKRYGFIGINYNIDALCNPALMLGIHLQGCGFVNLPLNDQTLICSKLSIRFILSHSIMRETKLICEFDIFGKTIKLLELESIVCAANNPMRDEFAYAVTTSGSTGVPKIVKVPHACIVPNIIDLRENLPLSRADKIAQVTAHTFDPSVVEIFLSLSSGSTLFVVSSDIISSPNKLLHLIHEYKVNFLQITPSLWLSRWSNHEIKRTILGKDSHLKVLLFGGEPLPKLDLIFALKHVDNKTRIYNIYGITEVSCWASINEIDSVNPDHQYLGKLLSDTIFQVRNECGEIIHNGEGILYIGSSTRICLLDGEEWCLLKAPVFRKSGDIVTVDGNSKLFYKGRCNRTVKRYGNRINLTKLETHLLQLNCVETCLAIWDEKNHKLYLCISTMNHKEMSNAITSDLECEKEIEKQLSKLPAPYQPDKIKYFENFQLTVNGKICTKSMMEIFKNTDESCLTSRHSTSMHTQIVCEQLEQVWKNHLTITDSGFLESGGTSITALQISTELATRLNMEFPELIGLLLKNETLNGCTNYVKNKFQSSRQKDDNEDYIHSCSSQTQSHISKRIKFNFVAPDSIITAVGCLWQKCRGQIFGIVEKNILSRNLIGLKLSIEYTHDLKKCVDASPTVFNQSSGEIYASVGSHSGIILTRQLNDPNSISYKVKLPDRIEASVLVLEELNGIVGCYDGYVYCLSLKTGCVNWKFKTKDTVKCTAAISSNRKTIFVGSYDKHLYSICIKNGSEVWKLKASEGSISATPRTCSKSNSVIFGTLDGTCIALNQDSGQINWKIKFKDPIFSAPALLKTGDIVFCTVSGEVKCFNSGTGSEIWTYKIDGNVFSHLVVKENLIMNTEELIIGSNNKRVYCISIPSITSTPILKYSVTFECPIFATPYCEDGLLVVADTGGNINLLDACNGHIITSLKLKGDIFSSPVINGDFIVIGCRDNNMYVIKINK
ncbi:beta-alanine-activating enzyme isoform X2 [Athalia rosae]|uniref:beta-alanine-activating enzyme isoform X2 n=1 Tax=Athalia rosae TaxID=37344 RepID=UPI00203358B8|nr:beta-alanine-activating enzyme isoform X2 [Athalia rosae]